MSLKLIFPFPIFFSSNIAIVFDTELSGTLKPFKNFELIISPSPFWPNFISNCGLDFLFIDTEHIAIDRSQVSWMCRSYTSLGLPPIVRLNSPDPYEVTKFLDDGAAVIISLYTESVEEVTKLRGATNIRPLKGRMLKQILISSVIDEEMKSYLSKFNKKLVLLY